MTDELIEEDVRQLLREHIHSYEQLEVLVLLAGTPGDPWSAERAAATIPISVTAAAEALQHLTSRALLSVRTENRIARYTFQSESEQLAAAVGGLARAYAGQRLEVMNLMSANAVERVRNSAIQAFAGAFLFRRKPDA